MKQVIIDALNVGAKVRFYFDKENFYTANELIDHFPNDYNFIQVSQNGKNVRIINLSQVTSISLSAN